MNGTQPIVQLDRLINASPTTVFDCLLKPELIDRWMPTTSKVDPRVGGLYSFGWGHGPTTIIELEPARLLAYDWHYPDHPETAVRWQLQGEGDGTRVDFTHEGWNDDGGWREALDNLKVFAEGRQR